MHCVLFAERAVLIQLQSFRIVLLILHRVIVSVFAFGAFECDFGSVDGSHFSKNSVQKNHTFLRCVLRVYHNIFGMSTDFAAGFPPFLNFGVYFLRFSGKPAPFFAPRGTGFAKPLRCGGD